MTVLRSFRAIALVLSFVLSLAAQAWAADKLPAPSIMVVDIQKVMSDAKSSKKVLETREMFYKKYQQEFSTEETKLREEDKQISEQRTVLSPEAYAEKRRVFDTKAAEFNRKVQLRRISLDRAYDLTMRDIAVQLSKVIRELSAEMGANIVLARTQVEYYEPAMDKTAQALERLNATVKELTFPDPVKMADEAQAKASDAAKAAKDTKKK
ncbi:MAG: OmpH family outer membrane protein [Alphaproteobacteria bacterium]|jgi:outer membrane protein|nr:OmpH family outer membrane protein [Alphaproteobacteria bacterium]